MNFQKNTLDSEIIGILDIGTSKVRVAICAIKNREIELLWYGEKRQDEHDIIMQEIQNIEAVCENIAQALKKAEIEAGVSPDNLIINIPTTEIFLEHSQLNYVREPLWDISKGELYQIMTHLEKNALRKHYKTIKQNSGYSENELKLIISNIAKIKVDGKENKQLIGTNPSEISLSLTNVFLPANKYDIIEDIENFLDKKISQVIPTEYSLSHLFPDHSDMVMIDIGSSHTSIVVQRDSTIIGAKKLAFGISDLIKKIQKKYKLSQFKIIQSIDQNIFEPEKEEFLDIFHDILAIAIEEIIGKAICPHYFFMSGGGANGFIKNYISSNNLNRKNLKIAKPVAFIIPQLPFMNPDDSSWVDTAKSNINIFSLIRSTLDFIKKDKSQVERTLQEVISDLEQ